MALRGSGDQGGSGGQGAERPHGRPGSVQPGGRSGGHQSPTSPVPTGEESKPPPTARSEATWFALAGALAGLIVVAVFILQNLNSVRVTFFWAHWRIPLGVDLLLATVLGGLVVFAAGSIRILQLRRLAKRQAVVIDRQSGR